MKSWVYLSCVILLALGAPLAQAIGAPTPGQEQISIAQGLEAPRPL